jgi:hypothetical protein
MGIFSISAAFSSIKWQADVARNLLDLKKNRGIELAPDREARAGFHRSPEAGVPGARFVGWGGGGASDNSPARNRLLRNSCPDYRAAR